MTLSQQRALIIVLILLWVVIAWQWFLCSDQQMCTAERTWIPSFLQNQSELQASSVEPTDNPTRVQTNQPVVFLWGDPVPLIDDNFAAVRSNLISQITDDNFLLVSAKQYSNEVAGSSDPSLQLVGLAKKRARQIAQLFAGDLSTDQIFLLTSELPPASPSDTVDMVTFSIHTSETLPIGAFSLNGNQAANPASNPTGQVVEVPTNIELVNGDLVRVHFRVDSESAAPDEMLEQVLGELAVQISETTKIMIISGYSSQGDDRQALADYIKGRLVELDAPAEQITAAALASDQVITDMISGVEITLIQQ